MVVRECISDTAASNEDDVHNVDVITSTDLGIGTSIATNAIPPSQVLMTRVVNLNEVKQYIIRAQWSVQYGYY